MSHAVTPLADYLVKAQGAAQRGRWDDVIHAVQSAWTLHSENVLALVKEKAKRERKSKRAKKEGKEKDGKKDKKEKGDKQSKDKKEKRDKKDKKEKKEKKGKKDDDDMSDSDEESKGQEGSSTISLPRVAPLASFKDISISSPLTLDDDIPKDSTSSASSTSLLTSPQAQLHALCMLAVDACDANNEYSSIPGWLINASAICKDSLPLLLHQSRIEHKSANKGSPVPTYMSTVDAGTQEAFHVVHRMLHAYTSSPLSSASTIPSSTPPLTITNPFHKRLYLQVCRLIYEAAEPLDVAMGRSPYDFATHVGQGSPYLSLSSALIGLRDHLPRPWTNPLSSSPSIQTTQQHHAPTFGSVREQYSIEAAAYRAIACHLSQYTGSVPLDKHITTLLHDPRFSRLPLDWVTAAIYGAQGSSIEDLSVEASLWATLAGALEILVSAWKKKEQSRVIDLLRDTMRNIATGSESKNDGIGSKATSASRSEKAKRKIKALTVSFDQDQSPTVCPI